MIMREIKFRGYDNEHSKWVYGYYTKLVEYIRKIHAIIAEEKGELVRYYIHDRTTIGQFTGLHDKNGKEIYEGDILDSVLYDCWEYPHVMYSNEKCAFGAMTGWDLEPLDFYYISQNIVDDFEVIGNIHETPELIKGK